MKLTDKIFAAGVVGCGGAGFPTHIKLKGDVEFLIVNGAECEPLLRTDRYLMIHYADKLVAALGAVGKELNAKKMVIALKKTYRREIECLREAIQRASSPVELFLMENYYPAGDEQMIVCEVTGRVIPPAGLPIDVGAIVSNVFTMLCVEDAAHGIPFTHRVLTVTGEVNRPVIVHSPIGTSIKECIALAGGSREDDYRVLVGGPLMGSVLTGEELRDAVVTKTTSGIVLLKPEDYLPNQPEISLAHMVNRARAACIQCSLCTQLCPRHLIGHPLEPHRIMRKLAYTGSIGGMLDDADAKGALLCCECNICTQFACPMHLEPGRVNSLLKKEYAAAGTRYQKTGGEYAVRPGREDRKVPSKRIAARVDVLKYYDYAIDEMMACVPRRVEIPVSQHIGAPAVPVVAPGAAVERGQLIAQCPQGKLGANIHASIGGQVMAADERIVIESGQGGTAHG